MNAHHHSLTEEQQKYIRDNYKEESLKHIAKKLHVPRHAVQRFHKHILEEKAREESAPKAEPSKVSSKVMWTSIVLFLLLLIIAFSVRKNTFNLPHYRGDQHHYIGLAHKLDEQGISGYNLRSIDMYGNPDYPSLVTFATAKEKGHVLKSLSKAGITYYDEPLHHMPFGFPAALMISHKIFAPGEPYHALAVNDTKIIQSAPRGVGLRNLRFNAAISGKQFYAIIVPLFCSLLSICLVYFLSRELFEEEGSALVAMALMSISPIAILTSQKIWADDLTLVLAIASALLYTLSVKREKLSFAFFSGVACGLSVITKQNGAIVGMAIVCWHFVYNWKKLIKKETCLSVIFDKKLLLFGLGGLVSSGYWFYKITATYGNPLYKPHQENLLEASQTAWFRMVRSRPKHLYLLGIPYQNPLFALAYIAPIWLWIKKAKRKTLLFPTIWLIVSFIVAYELMGGEHRYMLPSYPAFAILAGFASNQMRRSLDKNLGFRTGTVLLVIVLMVSFFWSVPMALDVVFHNGALIMRPF